MSLEEFEEPYQKLTLPNQSNNITDLQKEHNQAKSEAYCT
jgi:hypothetical protein